MKNDVMQYKWPMIYKLFLYEIVIGWLVKFVYYPRGCILIYSPLSYPFKFLIKFSKKMHSKKQTTNSSIFKLLVWGTFPKNSYKSSKELKSLTVKKNHIGSVVNEILWYIQTDILLFLYKDYKIHWKHFVRKLKKKLLRKKWNYFDYTILPFVSY